jgi:hypothetical protein
VKSFVNDTSFFEWDQATYNSYFKKFGNIEELTVPKLREMAYEQVELASVPFTPFIANKNRPSWLLACIAWICSTLARSGVE